MVNPFLFAKPDLFYKTLTYESKIYPSSLKHLFILFYGSLLDAKKNSDSLFPSMLLDSDGKEVPSNVLDNKIVGIYFSAQWCPPVGTLHRV